MRLDSKENVAVGWDGANDRAQIPVRPTKSRPVSERLGAIEEKTVARNSWANIAMKFVAYAVSGLLMLTAVPVAVVAVYGGRASIGDMNGVADRLNSIDRLRSLSAPQDPAITPMQAGVSFRSLQTQTSNVDFPMRPAVTAAPRPWRQQKAPVGSFQPRSPEFDGPSPQWVIQISMGGYSPRETEYLKSVADWPLWKDFDAVAAAKSVDIIGGMFVLPFKATAFSREMPILHYNDLKELAYAGASRVAYYAATGDTPRAEAAARSIVSFGFVLVDNGSNALDAMNGRKIVEIGRSAMEQLSMTTGRSENPTTFESHAGFVRSEDAPPSDDAVSGRELRARQLVDLSDQSLPRSVRLERLSQLSLTSCHNITEMMLGPGADIKDAFAQARSTLARFPSEQAYVDLLAGSVSHIPNTTADGTLGERLAIGAATVASAVTGNPRLAACTRFALANR